MMILRSCQNIFEKTTVNINNNFIYCVFYIEIFQEMEQGVKNKDWTTRVSSIHEVCLV